MESHIALLADGTALNVAGVPSEIIARAIALPSEQARELVAPYNPNSGIDAHAAFSNIGWMWGSQVEDFAGEEEDDYEEDSDEYEDDYDGEDEEDWEDDEYDPFDLGDDMAATASRTTFDEEERTQGYSLGRILNLCKKHHPANNREEQIAYYSQLADGYRRDQRLDEATYYELQIEQLKRLPALATKERLAKAIQILLQTGAQVRSSPESFCVQWRTEPIVLDNQEAVAGAREKVKAHVELGPFEVKIGLTRRRGNVVAMATALDPNPSHHGGHHPNIQNRQICLGSGSTDTYYSLTSGNLDYAREVVDRVLHTYGENAHYKLSDWGGEPIVGVSCSDCGDGLDPDDYTTCSRCTAPLCDDCTSRCDVCGDSWNCVGCNGNCTCGNNSCRNNCGHYCHDCSGYRCEGCLDQCSQCGVWVCHDCEIIDGVGDDGEERTFCRDCRPVGGGGAA